MIRHKFVRTYMGSYLNGYGVDIFVNPETGAAHLVACKNGKHLKGHKMSFQSLEKLESYLDCLKGNSAGKLAQLLGRLRVAGFCNKD